MKPLSPAQIRESFVNASQGEADRVPMPGLHEVIWEDREYLGWRDQQARQRGYLVHWRGDTVVGIVLRASDRALKAGISAMCSLCRVTQPSDQVTLFSAAMAGQSGRDGNTIGTYICDDLACSHMIRVLPPPHPMQIPRDELLAQRSETLLARVQAFTAGVTDTAL